MPHTASTTPLTLHVLPSILTAPVCVADAVLLGSHPFIAAAAPPAFAAPSRFPAESTESLLDASPHLNVIQLVPQRPQLHLTAC